MRWSLKVGRLFGIDLYLHATFIILILWLLGSHYLQDRNALAALSSVGFILLLFAIIVLHELGHALTARKFGIKTRDITLLPIGGVARLERIPSDPIQELIVAIAGPAVNLAIALVLTLFVIAQGSVGSLFNASLIEGNLLPRLVLVNLWLAFFNLIPAFPMDGGRVLRALLAMRLGRVQATEIAAAVGQALAFLFGFIGFFVNPFLIFVALFVWIGAEAEANEVRFQSLLKGVKVNSVMATNFKTLRPHETLGMLAKELIPGFQTDFPVVENKELLGFLGIEELVKGIRQSGEDATVSEFMQKEFISATPDQDLSEVLPRWQDSGTPALAVIDNGELIGIVNTSNLGEYVMVQGAIHQLRDEKPRS